MDLAYGKKEHFKKHPHLKSWYRSYLINVLKIESILPKRNNYQANFQNGQTAPISRKAYQKEIKDHYSHLLTDPE